MFRNRRLARIGATAGAALLAGGIAACSSSSAPATAASWSASASAAPSATVAAVAGGPVRAALPAGARLDDIWPYMPAASASQYNAEGFQMLMYRPLYMFGNNGDSVSVNYPLSLANAPVYSNGDKTITITMKGWKWSNGEAVDASDVI